MTAQAPTSAAAMPKKKEIQITVLSSRLEVSTKRKNLFYSPRKALDELPVGKASRERYLLGSALVDYGDLVDASDGASEIVKTDAVQSSCYLEILEEEDSDSDDDDDDYAPSFFRDEDEAEVEEEEEEEESDLLPSL
mmetsp:Transcript_3867/g.12006  ORF Transcript_3867/g.12006 Transcript_3867/m.12006 type:complete len:137 (-) Transcript_3867:1199-1609(-)